MISGPYCFTRWLYQSNAPSAGHGQVVGIPISVHIAETVGAQAPQRCRIHKPMMPGGKHQTRSDLLSPQHRISPEREEGGRGVIGDIDPPLKAHLNRDRGHAADSDPQIAERIGSRVAATVPTGLTKPRPWLGFEGIAWAMWSSRGM